MKKEKKEKREQRARRREEEGRKYNEKKGERAKRTEKLRYYPSGWGYGYMDKVLVHKNEDLSANHQKPCKNLRHIGSIPALGK